MESAPAVPPLKRALVIVLLAFFAVMFVVSIALPGLVWFHIPIAGIFLVLLIARARVPPLRVFPPVTLVALCGAFAFLAMCSFQAGADARRQRREVQDLIQSAERAANAGDLDKAVTQLQQATGKKFDGVPERGRAETLIRDYRKKLVEQQRQEVNRMIGAARLALAVGDSGKALAAIQPAASLSYAPNQAAAASLRAGIVEATSEPKAKAVLLLMSEAEFSAFAHTGQTPATPYYQDADLNTLFTKALRDRRAIAGRWREEEKARLAAERQRKDDLAQRMAEADRAKEERASREKAARDAEEKARVLQFERELVKIKASDLMAQYKANEIAADRAYKGKWLEVTGYVKNVGKDILNERYVALYSEAQFDILCVQCYFGRQHDDALASVRAEGQCTLRGRCEGMLLNVVMKDCYFPK